MAALSVDKMLTEQLAVIAVLVESISAIGGGFFAKALAQGVVVKVG